MMNILPFFLRMKQNCHAESSQMTDKFGHRPLWIMAAVKVRFLAEWKLANTVANKVGFIWAVTGGICALVSLSSYGIWR